VLTAVSFSRNKLKPSMGVRKLERFTNELTVTANDSSLMSLFSDINTDKIHRSVPKGKKMCVKYELS